MYNGDSYGVALRRSSALSRLAVTTTGNGIERIQKFPFLLNRDHSSTVIVIYSVIKGSLIMTDFGDLGKYYY